MANKTAPGAVDEEVAHTAYMACWAADDAGIEHAACDPYYTPRGEENTQQECECNVSEPAEDFVNETAANATVLAGNATAFVNQTVEDPENATEHAKDFLDAVVAFAGSSVERAVGFVEDVIGGLEDCIGLSVTTGLATTQALGTVFGLLGDVVALGALTMQEATLETGDLLADVGSALGHGVSVAAGATGDAFVAVGDAIADAAQAVSEAVRGLFGSEPSGDALDDPIDDVAGDLVDADGLLDPVERLLS